MRLYIYEHKKFDWLDLNDTNVGGWRLRLYYLRVTDDIFREDRTRRTWNKFRISVQDVQHEIYNNLNLLDKGIDKIFSAEDIRTNGILQTHTL